MGVTGVTPCLHAYAYALGKGPTVHGVQLGTQTQRRRCDPDVCALSLSDTACRQ